MAEGSIALEARGLHKAFGRTVALRDASLQLLAGEAHGLVGENGAGKSSLLKIITGVYRADAGRLLLAGQPFAPRGPVDARRAGIALVPQELRVVPEMSVADNLLLGRWPVRRRFGLAAVDQRALHAEASAALDRLGIALDVRRPMHALSFAEAQAVVLAHALAAGGTRLLILDEPTASLERAEVDRLFLLLDRLRAAGVALVFVSHRLEEVRRLCDRVTVLRDGAVVARHPRGAFTEATLAQDMTGRTLDAVHAGGTRASREDLLALPVAGAVDGGVRVVAGRVTGLAGLLGSGTGPLLRRAFGAGRWPQRLRLRGAERRLAHPAEAIRAGLGYVPSERSRALVPALSVRDNILLPHLPRLTKRLGRFDVAQADALVAELVRRLDVRPADPSLPVRALSGGNQQKVIFARWLVGGFHTLLLDEPTHGIDVAAKRQVLRLVDAFAAEGGGVLLASAELHELLALADTVVAMRENRTTAALERGTPAFTEAALRGALGG